MARPDAAEATGKRDNLVAAVWGFAEATLFFVVPDVFLTFLALRSRRRALVAGVFAAAGAVVGGMTIYAWGTADPATARAAVEAVPAISTGAVDRIGASLERSGTVAVFAGAFIGRPYKVYALQAALLDLAPAWFLAVSFPARLVRFVLATWIAAAISARMAARWSLRARALVLGLFWIVFYAAFGIAMPW